MDLFYMGGPLFMGVLTIIFVVMISVAIIQGKPVYAKGVVDEQTIRKIGYVKSVGLFALIIGMLGQLIGLFSAFGAIELGLVPITPELLATAFKISMITTLYGVVIYAISYLIWFGLSAFLRKA